MAVSFVEDEDGFQPGGPDFLSTFGRGKAEAAVFVAAHPRLLVLQVYQCHGRLLTWRVFGVLPWGSPQAALGHP